MPMDVSRYPENWNEISIAIRHRDGWRCKFCGVPNGAIGYRVDGNFVMIAESREEVETAQHEGWRVRRNGSWRWTAYREVSNVPIAQIECRDATEIVLTVAHLGVDNADGSRGDPSDKHDCRDENLAALCQRCHLMYDLRDHVKNSRQRRRSNQLAAGQAYMSI